MYSQLANNCRVKFSWFGNCLQQVRFIFTWNMSIKTTRKAEKATMELLLCLMIYMNGQAYNKRGTTGISFSRKIQNLI